MPELSSLIAIIVVGLIATGVIRLVLRPKMPPTSTFRCARCSTVKPYSERTVRAWRGGAKRLFCDACHQRWLNERHPVASGSRASHRVTGNRGCLGVAILLACAPLALLVVLLYA